jgi:trimethylamine--corrinoid protein Co-methyltransferase
MAREKRGGGRRGKSSRSTASIQQLPWQTVINTTPKMELLNQEQLEKLHQTSMRILSEAGIRVMGDNVMDLFEGAGAIVDRDTKTIRIDESIVMKALETVPETFTLTSRNPAKRITLGGNNVTFGLVAGPPNVHDCINGRRAGNFEDYCNFIKLAHHFNAVHLIGNQVTAPQEMPANNRHLDT